MWIVSQRCQDYCTYKRTFKPVLFDLHGNVALLVCKVPRRPCLDLGIIGPLELDLDGGIGGKEAGVPSGIVRLAHINGGVIVG